MDAALRYTFAPCSCAMRWRDQIDDPTLELSFQFTDTNDSTNNVTDQIPMGSMQTPTMGNNAFQQQAKNFYYCSDHVGRRVATSLSCNSTIETLTLPSSSTVMESYLDYVLVGGNVSLSSKDYQATRKCFNAAVIVQALASPLYMGMSGTQINESSFLKHSFPRSSGC